MAGRLVGLLESALLCINHQITFEILHVLRPVLAAKNILYHNPCPHKHITKKKSQLAHHGILSPFRTTISCETQRLMPQVSINVWPESVLLSSINCCFAASYLASASASLKSRTILKLSLHSWWLVNGRVFVASAHPKMAYSPRFVPVRILFPGLPSCAAIAFG